MKITRFILVLLICIAFVSCGKKKEVKKVEEPVQEITEIFGEKVKPKNVHLKKEDIAEIIKLKRVNLTRFVSISGKIAYDPGLVVAEKEYLRAVEKLGQAKKYIGTESEQELRRALKNKYNKLRKLGLSKSLISSLRQTKKIHTQVVDIEPVMWVYADFEKSIIPNIHTSQIFNLKIDKYPDRKYIGKVLFVNKKVKLNSGKTRVVLEVKNTALRLKPNMSLIMSYINRMENVIAVPKNVIIKDDEGKKIVWIEEHPDTYTKKEVVLGETGIYKSQGKRENYIIIKQGLREGQRVIIKKL
ncbi:efflux RND transporter periplasmic adaptor subunit [bacterium]